MSLFLVTLNVLVFVSTTILNVIDDLANSANEHLVISFTAYMV